MKFKYFLRGLGTGILFASIIFLTVYQGNRKTVLSDSEIKRRAQELGMVEKEDPLADLLTSTETTQASEALSGQDLQKTSTNTEKQGEKDTQTPPDTEQVTENVTTENTAEPTTKEAPKENKKDTSADDTVKLIISRGDTSYPVSLKLKELGMIDDAEKFDTYLVEHNYANRMRVGEHSLKKGMDYHAIAEAISDPL